MQRINITLPDELARDFRRYIPTRKRSSFIAEAVKAKLPKRNLKKELVISLKANSKLYKQEAKIWDVTVGDGLDKW